VKPLGNVIQRINYFFSHPTYSRSVPYIREAQLWAHVSVWRFVGMPHIDNVCAFIVRAQVVHGIAELGEADLGLAYDQAVFR
jgi:hypothetical protein